jgi:hypothetical protein
MTTNKKNAFLFNNYHHKNQEFLNNYVKNNFILTNNFQEADIVFSASTFIPIEQYPNKKFIFGNHFSVFPNRIVRQFNNIHKNAVYIQPSQPSVNTWQQEFNFTNLPMKAIPFGVNTHKFKPDIDRRQNKSVLVYYKNRNPVELQLLETFLQKKNIEYKVFSYLNRYEESDFLKQLKKSKYGIWLGRHESQGFAVQETLSCDIPLLVWDVKLRKQEWTMREAYKNVLSPVTAIPYWDKKCGEFFYNYDELEKKFDIFIKNVDTYEPRKFILENLSQEKCYEKWNKFTYDL